MEKRECSNEGDVTLLHNQEEHHDRGTEHQSQEWDHHSRRAKEPGLNSKARRGGISQQRTVSAMAKDDWHQGSYARHQRSYAQQGGAQLRKLQRRGAVGGR